MAREQAGAVPSALTDPNCTDSYLATSGLDTILWWNVVDYGFLSNLEDSTAVNSQQTQKWKGTATIGSHDVSATRDPALISRSPQGLASSVMAPHTNILESSIVDTFENDLETLLADWHEDGATFPQFTTALDDMNVANKD